MEKLMPFAVRDAIEAAFRKRPDLYHSLANTEVKLRLNDAQLRELGVSPMRTVALDDFEGDYVAEHGLGGLEKARMTIFKDNKKGVWYSCGRGEKPLLGRGWKQIRLWDAEPNNSPIVFGRLGDWQGRLVQCDQKEILLLYPLRPSVRGTLPEVWERVSKPSRPLKRSSEDPAPPAKRRSGKEDNPPASQAAPAPPPEDYKCPLTLAVMDTVVVTKYGHSYEKAQLEEWVRANGSCPKTRAPLSLGEIFPNIALQGAIEQWRKACP